MVVVVSVCSGSRRWLGDGILKMHSGLGLDCRFSWAGRLGLVSPLGYGYFRAVIDPLFMFELVCI